jgi:hypothetical protein
MSGLRTLYDLLHQAEKSEGQVGIADFDMLVKIALPGGGPGSDDSNKLIQTNVTSFSVAVLNPSDIRVDHRIEPDRIFLHDVYSNLAFIFGNVSSSDEYSLAGNNAQEIVKRAKSLRMSLEQEVILSSSPQLRGNTLQRIVRLGKEYMHILRLFYAINAVSVAKTGTLVAMNTLKGKHNSGQPNEVVLKNAIALSRIIPVSTIAESVYINNMLTGTSSVNSDIDDKIVDYAAAVKLIFA